MRLVIFTLSLLVTVISFGQSSYIPQGNDAYHIYQRLSVKSGIDSPIHGSLKYYSRKDIVEFANAVKNSGVTLSPKDLFDLQYLLDDSNEFNAQTGSSNRSGSGNYKKKYVDSLFYTVEEESGTNFNENGKTYRKPLLKYFYKTPANFFEVEKENFNLKINPVVNINFGKDIDDNEDLIFQNTRGIEIRGLIDEKVYFYTNLYETQGNFNDFILERIDQYKAIPGFGNYKDGFSSSISDKFKGFDFPNSQAYFGVNVTKHVGIELGHSRHFIGNGYNSLLLSDYANNYFYLKFSTKIWKLHYQNIFAEMAPISAGANIGDVLLPKKYMANHYLSFKIRKNLEIGLFETIMFSRANHFEFQYLNPVILYRTVEFFLDSPDNVLIGLNANWNFLNKFSLYGQLILDEFKLNELKNSTGWWANKFGVQAGLKYIDAFGIDHLDAQVEYNLVRPYTYGQRRELVGFPEYSVSNYSHYSQPLAHPLGANFTEIAAILKYKPTNKIDVKGRLLLANYGDSVDSLHWGNNILRPNDQRVQDYDNEIGQGVSTTVFQLGLDVSYQFFHNYYVDFNVLLRDKNSALDQYDLKTTYFGLGIRANVSRLKIDY